MSVDDLINQPLTGPGQHKTAHMINHRQDKANRRSSPIYPHQPRIFTKATFFNQSICVKMYPFYRAHFLPQNAF